MNSNKDLDIVKGSYSNVFFTSDLHLGDRSIIGLRNKLLGTNFLNTKEMDDYIYDAWHSVVGPNDIVWVLGDVAMGIESLYKLGKYSGRKSLVLGNNDEYRSDMYAKYFHNIRGAIYRYGFMLTHCPVHLQEVSQPKYGINVHGHIHHAEHNLGLPYINVNFDARMGNLVTLEEIQDEIAGL